jgi:hypothetical protein
VGDFLCLHKRAAALLAASLAALAILIAPAGAVIVAPGAVEAVPATTSAASPDLAGGVQNDNLIAFSITDGMNVLVSGNLQNRVTESNNLGTLIFAPRLRDLTFAQAVEIVGIRLEGFGDFVLDIAFRTDGIGDVGPDTVTRSGDGDTLDFSYDPSIVSLQEALFISILSNAEEYALTGVATIFARDRAGNLFSTRLEGLAVPVLSEVPLPAAAPLFLGGLALAGAWARRKKKAAAS